jgi:hypothetical protein
MINVPVAIILPSACSIIEEPVYNISSNPAMQKVKNLDLDLIKFFKLVRTPFSK